MAMPANVGTGKVQGRFIVGVADGPDPDDEPDAIPAQGTITFTASVPYLPNPTSAPSPTTLLKVPIVAVLDSEGYLSTPDPSDPAKAGARGIRLVATDDPDLSVQGWTWNVTYSFQTVNGVRPQIASHSIALPTGATVDLTSVVRVPSSTGIGAEQAEALAAAAASAAQEAAAAAQTASEAAQATDAGVASFIGRDLPTATTAALADSTVMQSLPTPTDNVVTATPVQHSLPAATPHDAFPGLTRTGDGSYLASWRGGEGHNSSDGMVYLSRSWDGRAWSTPVAVPSDVHPDGDARDVSVSQLGEYTTLTYYSAGANLSYIRKSTDNGETWGPSIYLPFNSGGIEFISAPAVEVNGAWLVTAYGNSAVRVLRSTDQGETWSAPIVVATGGVQEPNLIALDGEQVRIVWRTNYDGIAKTALSTDGGLTWGPASDAYWGQGNPHLVRLRSGAVVSTYKSSAGHSTNRYSYACARISFDGGATWGPETVFGYASRKMTYAQAVETDIDGEMLCVWSAETSNTAARLYSVRLTHGGAITRGGEAPSPVTPRAGIARQVLSLQKSVDQTISPGAWVTVEWEDERADHWEGFNPARSLTDFSVDETGLYVVTFRASWNINTPFSLAIAPEGAAQILHNSWNGGGEGFVKDGSLCGVVELVEGVKYQARVHAGSVSESRRLLSGNYAYRTRMDLAKIKGF